MKFEGTKHPQIAPMAKIELRESLSIKNDSIFFQYCSINSSPVRIVRASMVK